MFNKPKFKIGSEVFVVKKSGEEAEVHKTKVLSYEFSVVNGWSIELEKTWSSGYDMWMFTPFGSTTSNLFKAERVFATEEEAKEAAVEFAKQFKKEEEDEKIKSNQERIKYLKEQIKTAEHEINELTK